MNTYTFDDVIPVEMSGSVNRVGFNRITLKRLDNDMKMQCEYRTWGDAFNAVYFANRIFFFVSWSDITDKEKNAFAADDILLCFLPMAETPQFIVKFSSMQWSDVIPTFGPNRYMNGTDNGYMNVIEFVFVMIDSDENEVVAMRRVYATRSLSSTLGLYNNSMYLKFSSSNSYFSDLSPEEMDKMSVNPDDYFDGCDMFCTQVFNVFNSEYKWVSSKDFVALSNLRDVTRVMIEGDRIVSEVINQ